MARVDPFISLHEWRSALYRGEPADIDRFLDTIDATLPPGWARDRAYESARPRPERIRCYLFDQASDAAVRVWLQRVTPTRVRGGPIQVLRHPPSGIAPRIGRLVAELNDACVLPAVGATGARCTRPAFGPRSVVSAAAETLFTTFADAADGEWPFSDRIKELWDDLISGCLAEQVAINRDELVRWLTVSGWDQKDITAMTDRFFADSAWFAKRLALAAP